MSPQPWRKGPFAKRPEFADLGAWRRKTFGDYLEDGFDKLVVALGSL